MKRSLSIVMVFFCTLLISVIGVWATPEMNGEWKINTSIEMPGMPMEIPGGSFTHCMDEQGVPHQADPEQDCATLSRTISGDTVNWRMKCTGPDGVVEMEGSSTYTGNSMQGSITMSTGRGTMTMNMQGEKLGPCR